MRVSCGMGRTLVLGAGALAGLNLFSPIAAAATPHGTSVSQLAERSLGRPTVHLDRLEFPEHFENAAYYRRHLVQVLKREARKADWGAGRGNRIEYRFAVRKLALKVDDDVLHVACTAVGRLPGGKTAKSNLTFGGNPRKRRELVRRVLQIVARGVITRLAELERERRGLD